MYKLLYFLLFTALLSCASDPAPEAETPEAADDNASLIRNPVANDADSTDVARMSFEAPEYLFGEVPEGTLVTHEFTFTNTGSVPLMITDARSTCGCTVPSYPERPIPPGGTGTVRVEFNTAHKYGRQRKPVTLTANTYPSMTTVYVDGTVLND
ncbi:DUF1573 domain-containing protein [Lewinella sp. IMCC34183]|uniref:DUF1573 domain-containing protein n=1 Tax=Lewinella sp. IMCC34183 TaxID=2248762 RepID=UPI000E2311F3|nr:DUF1573 domain-containing protein [Lewinella sp. IMCC34183]